MWNLPLLKSRLNTYLKSLGLEVFQNLETLHGFSWLSIPNLKNQTLECQAYGAWLHKAEMPALVRLR